MSDLRNHLDRLRAAYGHARYPGDLASDILRPRYRIRRLWPALGAAAAIAAALLLAIRLPHHTLIPNITPAVADNEELNQESNLAPTTSLSLQLPAGSSVVPPASDLSPDINLSPANVTFTIPSAPVVPSLDSATDSDSYDAEES